MDWLPVDVLCYVLEQFEMAAWLVRLRSVNRIWRRAVDRVAGRALPLGLLQSGEWVEQISPIALPFEDDGTSHALLVAAACWRWREGMCG